MYVCMYVYMYAWYLRKPEEGVGSLGTGVTDSFEPPYWCWELNPDPLQMLLSTKPSVQTPRILFCPENLFNLLEVDLLLTPFSIKPIFHTLHFRKPGQGITPSNSPQLQIDVGTGKLRGSVSTCLQSSGLVRGQHRVKCCG